MTDTNDTTSVPDEVPATPLPDAQRSDQTPLVDAPAAIAAKRRAFMRLPRRRWIVGAAVGATALAAVTLVRWPLRVRAYQPRFRAANLTEVRTLVPGIVERVYVRQGARVQRGDSLVQLRDVELRSQRASVAATEYRAQRAAAVAAGRGNAAGADLQRARAAALLRQMAVLDSEIAAMTLRAPVSGFVLTPRPEAEIGARLDAGSPVITLGKTDTLTLDFGVAQTDLARVRTGQEVRLRVDGLARRTFDGRVTFLGELPLDGTSAVLFPVRAAVPNAGDLVKPGTAVHARVLTAPTSLAGRVLRGPARWLRLLWWRLRP